MANGAGSNTESVAQDELKSLVRRIEVRKRLVAENADKSEIYKEARGSGFDVRVLRKVVAARRADPDQRAEQDALFDLYWSAINGVVPAHVETPSEFPAGEDSIIAHGEPIPTSSRDNSNVIPDAAVVGATSPAGVEGEGDRQLHPVAKASEGNAADVTTSVVAEAAGSKPPPVTGGSGDASRPSVGGGSDAPILESRPAEAVVREMRDAWPDRQSDTSSAPAEATGVEMLLADSASAPVGPDHISDLPKMVEPWRSDVQRAMDAVKAKGKPDRTKVNPICRDPVECDVYASWNHTCLKCLRLASEQARANGPDPRETEAAR